MISGLDFYDVAAAEVEDRLSDSLVEVEEVIDSFKYVQLASEPEDAESTQPTTAFNDYNNNNENKTIYVGTQQQKGREEGAAAEIEKKRKRNRPGSAKKARKNNLTRSQGQLEVDSKENSPINHRLNAKSIETGATLTITTDAKTMNVQTKKAAEEVENVKLEIIPKYLQPRSSIMEFIAQMNMGAADMVFADPKLSMTISNFLTRRFKNSRSRHMQ